MEVIENKTKKRTLDDSSTEYGERDEDIISYFNIFEPCKKTWQVMSRIQNMGYLYMHRDTHRPLMIINGVNPNNDEIIALIIYIQTKECDEEQPVSQMKIEIRITDDKAEIYHTLDQINNKFINDLQINENNVLEYFRSFVKRNEIGLSFDFDSNDSTFKKFHK